MRQTPESGEPYTDRYPTSVEPGTLNQETFYAEDDEQGRKSSRRGKSRFYFPRLAERRMKLSNLSDFGHYSRKRLNKQMSKLNPISLISSSATGARTPTGRKPFSTADGLAGTPTNLDLSQKVEKMLQKFEYDGQNSYSDGEKSFSSTSKKTRPLGQAQENSPWRHSQARSYRRDRTRDDEELSFVTTRSREKDHQKDYNSRHAKANLPSHLAGSQFPAGDLLHSKARELHRKQSKSEFGGEYGRRKKQANKGSDRVASRLFLEDTSYRRGHHTIPNKHIGEANENKSKHIGYSEDQPSRARLVHDSSSSLEQEQSAEDMRNYLKEKIDQWKAEDEKKHNLDTETQKRIKLNEEVIARIEASLRKINGRKIKLKETIEQLRLSTQTKINDLAYRADNVNIAVEETEMLILQKERSLKVESHREKSRWEETLREKIKQQIAPKEQSYYDVIRQLQLEILRLKEGRQKSQPQFQFLDGVFHETIALTLSAVGTCFAFIVRLITLFLAPFLLLSRLLSD